MATISCDLSTLEKTCRLCLSPGGVLSSIFQDTAQDKDLISLPAKIVACVGVDVEITKENELPCQICHRCLYQVERLYDFKEQCQKTDRILRDYLAAKIKPPKDPAGNAETTEEKGESMLTTEVAVEDDDEDDDNDHDMGYAEGDGDECEDDDEEVSEADKALVESLAKCPDLRVVQPPCDSSMNSVCLDVADVVDVDQTSERERERRCHICATAFSDQQYFRAHVASHNADGPPFSCLVCLETFGERTTLDEHWRSHTSETLFSCPLCRSSFTCSETLEEHLQSHKAAFPFSFNCSDCDGTFVSASELSKHALIHAGLRPFKCQICPKEFSRTTNLNKHMRVHSGQRPYSCGECPKMFRTRGDMLRHQIIHTGQKPFSCSTCMISFNRKDKLTRHERLHLSEKPFSCTFCSMTFLRRDDLSRHSLMHLKAPVKEEHEQETATDLRVACKQQSEPRSEEELSTDAEPRLTIVEDAEEAGEADHPTATDKAQQMGQVDTSNHVESMVISVDPFHVNSTAVSVAAGATQPPCDSPTCWPPPQNLSVSKSKPAETDSKPYMCEICNKKFSDKSYMKTHQLTHLGVRPHACGYCGKAFFRRRELLRHEAVHTGLKPFQCKICQKAFARSDKLMRHERTHGNAQQYSCSHCPAKFVRKDDLTRHEMTHTGQKPHACSSCGKSFATKAELTRHEKTHAAKELRCELCAQVFTRKDKLAAHMRAHEANQHIEMPLVEGVDLRGLVAHCTRFGSDIRDHLRVPPIMSQSAELHLVPLKQN